MGASGPSPLHFRLYLIKMLKIMPLSMSSIPFPGLGGGYRGFDSQIPHTGTMKLAHATTLKEGFLYIVD